MGEPAGDSKTKLYAAIAGAAVVLMGGMMLFGGTDPGGLLVSVAAPDGTAIPGVKVSVNGEVRCTSSPCKVEELDPGSYVVTASADGYEEMAGKAFQVAEGGELPVNLELVPEATTGIKVDTPAPGLTLSLDGKKIGTAPQEIGELSPGQHTVELTGSQFFKPFRQQVTLAKGETLNFEPKLELEKGKVAIKLEGSAKKAEVTLVVNGKRRSITPHVRKGSPIILPVEGKEYTIIATRRGYDDFEHDLEFTVKEPVQTLTINLSKESDDSSSSSSSRSTSSRSSSSSRSSTTTSSASRAPATGNGKVNLNSIPVSNVIIDGRPLGQTPKMNLSVSPGSHTVVFVHPQHGRKVRTVTVKPGQTATAAVRFP